MPHRGYGVDRIVAQTFLHSQGVFGIALKVMFSYVFLFVVFGALLEATGAPLSSSSTWPDDCFRGASGGPAKVAVLSSGLMGSLSGSAVANTATTGTFTIPMMKSSGFSSHQAAGLEAAASSGGALVPPVMGAGAYMMLEIIDPPVAYLEIIRAALIPAILYYLSIFMIVHLRTRSFPQSPRWRRPSRQTDVWRWEGLVFLAGIGQSDSVPAPGLQCISGCEPGDAGGSGDQRPACSAPACCGIPESWPQLWFDPRATVAWRSSALPRASASSSGW